MKVGVLGGSFDPVHNGHLAIALAAVEQVGLDKVVFVPARRSPLKGTPPRAADEDRVAMLEAAIRDEPRFAVSRIELERADPSYTVDTLEAMAGEDRLYLILGADAAADLARWRDPERVLRLATLVVAPRDRVPVQGSAIALDTALIDLSARDLRERAARGRSLRYLVPDAVWRYIEDRGLYRARMSVGGASASQTS